MQKIVFITSFLAIFFITNSNACEQSKTFGIFPKQDATDNNKGQIMERETEPICKFTVTCFVDDNTKDFRDCSIKQDHDNVEKCRNIQLSTTLIPQSGLKSLKIFVQWKDPKIVSLLE